MNISEKRSAKEGGNFVRIGIESFFVCNVNPEPSWIKEFLGLQDEPKATEYLGEKDGNTTLRIDIWLEGENTGYRTKAQFFLSDKDVESKTGKLQYLNCTGDTAYVDDEANLQEWFKKFMKGKKPDRVAIGDKAFRKAKVGEQDLYEFLKNWLSSAASPVDFNSPTVDILLDFKKLMRGNVAELANLVGSDDVGPIGAMVEVRSVDKDGEIKNFSQIYPRIYFPGYKMKLVRNILSSPTPDWTKDYALKSFYESISDSEFGSKNSYFFGLLKDFDPEENLASTGKIINVDDSTY